MIAHGFAGIFPMMSAMEIAPDTEGWNEREDGYHISRERRRTRCPENEIKLFESTLPKMHH
jgi:hypothetical protein